MARTPRKRREQAIFLGLALGLVGVGCRFRREDAAAQRLRAQIQQQIGSAASVNVHTAYGSTTVTIRLAELPVGDSLALQQRLEALAKAEFPKTEYVVVLSGR